MATQQAAALPDEQGHFGDFGGKFIPETLMAAVAELEQAYKSVSADEDFQSRLAGLLATYVGRPTPLYFAENLTRHLGGAKIYLKREGKQRIIAETGAGQHGVAAATACAMLGLQCIVYMGEEDIRRQSLNVFRMRLLEAEVISVASGTKTLKDAINEAIRDWVTNVETTHYLIGSVVGPHPYPVMVRDFQSVIGREARSQILQAEGRLPDYVMACVGGGSNAMGTFYPFVPDEEVRLLGLEAGGRGLDSGEHSATLTAGRPGVLHGAMSYLLQDEDGQVSPAHSISAGLDYPGVGPEHSYLKDSGRAEYREVTDPQALEGFHLLCRTEGIIPALESAHAIYGVAELAPALSQDHIILVCLSGRGDKDIGIVAEAENIEL